MTSTQEHKSPAPGALDADPALLPRVENVVKTLVKLVSGQRLYAENNPRLIQFREEFHAALRQFFGEEPELVLTVEQHDLRWHGQSVYSNDKRDDSLAFLLYKDGVGEITVHERALEGELDAFVQIVTEESVATTQRDEDVVTRLWNADFDHISYRVIDDYLAGEMDAAEASDDVEVLIVDQPELLPSLEDKGRVIVKPTDPLESIDGYLRRLIMTNCEASDENDREAYFQDMVESFFGQDPEERERYHAERDAEQRDDGLAAFAETILVFTLLQDNPSAVRDVSGVLERIVDFVVVDREPRTLARLIALLRGFQDTQTLPENVAVLCDKLENRLTDPALVQSFEAELERWSDGTEHVLAYFESIGRPVVEPLLKLLHRVDGGRLHREICAVLIRAAGDEIEQVLDRMDIDNPEVARDAVFIAGKIELKSITPRVQELLLYPDRKVKIDMLELVSRIPDPGVAGLLMQAVADPDKEIRCRAMQTAALQGLPDVARYINRLALGKDIHEKDPDECEAIFKALGHVGDAVTVEHLRKFAERRRLLDFSGNRENKLLAIRALEYIQEPSAIELLQELGRDSNEAVRTRAMRALTALRTRMRSAGDGGES